MTLFNKVKWVFGIAIVFLLVLATNLIDQQNFMIIEDSIETIYADRIIAQDIIYDISKQVGQKQVDYVVLTPPQMEQTNKTTNSRIKEYIDFFAATKLTPKEEVIFTRLKKSFAKLQTAESAVIAEQYTRVELKADLANFREHLDELADIQVQEGKRELYESRKALGSAHLFTQLEIATLIIMAILVQVIILYTPKPGVDDN